MTDEQTVERVARAIFTAAHPSNMCAKDWDSGAILGGGNAYRDKVNRQARAVIAAMQPALAEADSLDRESDRRHETSEMLRAENERLREAHREIIDYCANTGRGSDLVDDRIIERCEEASRAALERKEGK